MKLELIRKWLTEKSTIGSLYIDGEFECYVLEDRYRPPPAAKIYGKTAIPCGMYEVRITWSPRFKRPLPLLIGVPGFEGVRIHPGNDADDTEGCLLPGLRRMTDMVLESRAAFAGLFEKMNAAQHVTGHVGSITISVAQDAVIP